MATPLVIIGAGGFGREVHDVVDAINAGRVGTEAAFELVGFMDDGDVDLGLLDERGDAPFLGPLATYEGMPADVQYVIGIGSGIVRRTIDEWAMSLGRSAATLIHPLSARGRRVEIGPGTVVCSHVSLTTNIRLGRHVHVNLNSTVGHDATLGDYVTVNPGVTISGNVTLEDEANVGTGASIIQGVTVGSNAVIGAGAAVVRDVPPGVTAAGVPARPLTPRG